MPAMPLPADPDDLPPTGEEARAQEQETVMPLIWAGLAILTALAFVAVVIFYKGVDPARPPPGPAPVKTALAGALRSAPALCRGRAAA
jgi:uncharacterized RDD family membrane protein YckC